MTDNSRHASKAWSGYSALASAMDVDSGPYSPPYQASFLLPNSPPIRPYTPSGSSWAMMDTSRSSTPQSLSPKTPTSPYTSHHHSPRIVSSGNSPFSSPLSQHCSPPAQYPSPFYSSLPSSSPSPESFRSPSPCYPSPRPSPLDLQLQRYLGRGVGQLIPQRAYQTHFKAGGDEPFHIDFRFTNARDLGIPLRLLLDVSAMDLPIQGADEVPFMPNISTTITLRIWWPGYVQYPRRLTMRKATGVLTRIELAMAIAECYKNFIDEARVEPKDVGTDQWRVGRGHITLKHLFLLRLTQVSQGSWQADIALERP
jgi:hypothetical protein